MPVAMMLVDMERSYVTAGFFRHVMVNRTEKIQSHELQHSGPGQGGTYVPQSGQAPPQAAQGQGQAQGKSFFAAFGAGGGGGSDGGVKADGASEADDGGRGEALGRENRGGGGEWAKDLRGCVRTTAAGLQVRWGWQQVREVRHLHRHARQLQ